MVKSKLGKAVLFMSCGLMLAACSKPEQKQEEVVNNFNTGFNSSVGGSGNSQTDTQEAYNNPLIDEEDPYLGLSFSMDTGESQRAGWYYQIKVGRDSGGAIKVAEFDYVNSEGELYSEVAEDGAKFKDRSNRYTKYLIEKQNLDNFFRDLGIDKDKASDGKTFYHAYIGDAESTAYTDVYEGYLTESLEGSSEGGSTNDTTNFIIPGAHEANLQAGQELVGGSDGGTRVKVTNGVGGFYEGAE